MSEVPLATGGSLAALSPAAAGGKRRSHKKLRLVKKKTVRRMLKKMGLKMRGGAPGGELVGKDIVTDQDATGAVIKTNGGPKGGRRRHTKTTHRRRHHRRSLFGMKY